VNDLRARGQPISAGPAHQAIAVTAVPAGQEPVQGFDEWTSSPPG
jgi:hypothetical protein